MSSPVRSVAVRLSMDPSAYISGAARAATATTALDREVAKVGGTATTSMERAASGMGSAEGALGNLNKSAGALGFTLGGLAGVGGAVAAALSVKWAGDYQSALTKLVTTAGETQQNIGMVGKGMLDMAGQVGIGADELAKGMYTVESSGIHGADALNVLKAAAQGARQENADLSKVTDAVTTALHDYNLPASDAAKVTSQLITAVSHGKTTFDELTGAMHSVTPLAAALGVPLSDVAGVLSSMTASGESADQAAQNMADTLRHMQNPTATMTSELSQLGITSSDLSTQLSTKGLSGTLQGISEAIITKLDPATQKVLLPAFNQSKTAAQDLQIMLSNMPPALAQVSQSLLDGTTSQGEYRKAAQQLGGQAGVLGDNFLSLYKNADGFSNILKSGSAPAQVYTAALQKAVGTSAGLTVALQVTGEHAAATNGAIKDIAGSAGDAAGNIKGWDEVQGNFNQQLAQSEANAKSLAIEAGQHLLPVLTGALGWINSTGVPALEHMGGAVKDAATWFGGLPGPIKEAAGALAGMALAEKIGLLTKLGDQTVYARVLLSEFGDSVRGSMGKVSAAFTGARDAQRLLTAEKWNIVDEGAMSKATGSIAGLGAAAGAAAKGGFAALKSGASGLMGLFGGPWGVTLVGATVGVMALQSAIQKHDEAIKTATTDVLNWNKAISLGGSGQAALDAAAHIGELQKQVADYQKVIDQANNPNNPYGRVSGTMIAHLDELKKELADGTQQWKDQLAAMTPVEEMQGRVDFATKGLNDTLKNNAPNSLAVREAADKLRAAQGMLAIETQNANQATKTQAQLQQDSANAMLANLDASRASEMAQLQLSDAVSQYNSDVAAGRQPNEDAAAYTRRLREEQLGLVSSAQSAAQKASDLAVQQDHQNGITDTAHDAQVAFLKSLQDSADQMSGPAKQAILDMITQLGKQQSQAQITSGAVSALGVTVTNLPSEHLITINAPTQQQEQDLHDLGYVTTHLPDGKVVVTADTHPAMAEIQDLLNYAHQQAITYRGDNPLNPTTAGTSQRMGTYADGGYTGPGAKYTPVGIVHANEFVFPSEAVNRLGTGFLGALAGLPGYASGGWTGLGPGGTFPVGSSTVPVSVDPATIRATEAAIHSKWVAAAAATAVGGPPTDPLGNVALGLQLATARGWGGMAEWTSLYKLWQRESGWRNTAQNPTSTAYGIPQFLDSTWATVGAHKTSDAAAQINAGLTYIAQRFRDPIGAWAHETQFGWYHDGGPVTGPAGATVPAFLKVGEVVRTADQEQDVQARLRSREFGGLAFSPVPPPQQSPVAATAPVIGELHVHNDVDLDLVLRQADFRRRQGTFV